MFSPHFLCIFSTPHFLHICYAEIRKKCGENAELPGGTPQRMRRSEVRDGIGSIRPPVSTVNRTDLRTLKNNTRDNPTRNMTELAISDDCKFGKPD